MYEVKILADSISPSGVRLLTVQATFPRFILAEVNTHRMLSRNSASSRAIPPEKLISRVIANPFVPETFNKRVKGMGVGEELGAQEHSTARAAWLAARDDAVRVAEVLLGLDCDKSRINRLLEPFLWHTAIISATEWDNFFALRDHPDAQPEFQKLARMMLETMMDSSPVQLSPGEWHLPLVFESDEQLVADHDTLPWISAARCAKVSYDRQEDEESPEDSLARAKRLAESGHLSPFEHPALLPKAALDENQHYLETGEFYGNFREWVQLRKKIPDEANAVGAQQGITNWEERLDIP